MKPWLPLVSLVVCIACTADTAAPLFTESGRPIVGRLELRDRTVDLSVEAFAGDHPALPSETIARAIMADIAIEATGASRNATGPRDPSR